MCRNIRVLYNFEPATTADEIEAAAIQYVRKVSGMQKPSQDGSSRFAPPPPVGALVQPTPVPKSLMCKTDRLASAWSAAVCSCFGHVAPVAVAATVRASTAAIASVLRIAVYIGRRLDRAPSPNE